jgi:hypothetical protein
MKQVWNKVMSTSKRQRQRVKHREKFINAIGRTVYRCFQKWNTGLEFPYLKHYDFIIKIFGNRLVSIILIARRWSPNLVLNSTKVFQFLEYKACLI